MKFLIWYYNYDQIARPGVELSAVLAVLKAEDHSYEFIQTEIDSIMRALQGRVNPGDAFAIWQDESLVGSDYRGLYRFLEKNGLFQL